MNVDRKKLKEMIAKKMEGSTDEIAAKLARYMANPNPQTTLDAEKGLHAETTRIADAIFKEVLCEVLADPEQKDAAAEDWKKRAIPSTNGDGKPPSS